MYDVVHFALINANSANQNRRDRASIRRKPRQINELQSPSMDLQHVNRIVCRVNAALFLGLFCVIFASTSFIPSSARDAPGDYKSRGLELTNRPDLLTRIGKLAIAPVGLTGTPFSRQDEAACH